MQVKPFKFYTENGKESIVFLPISPLGTIAYDGDGNVQGWCFDAEPNTEVSFLVGERLPAITKFEQLKLVIKI